MASSRIDSEIVAEIFAALGLAAAARSGAGAAEQIAQTEQVAQNIAEIGEGGGIEALAAHALQSAVAIAVIGGAFLRIAQNAIGFGRFLELFFGRLIVGVAIRMILHGHLSVGGFKQASSQSRPTPRTS